MVSSWIREESQGTQSLMIPLSDPRVLRQIGGQALKRSCHTHDHVERDVLFSSLNPAEVVPVAPNGLSQLLLGEPQIKTAMPQGSPEGFPVHRSGFASFHACKHTK